MAHRGPRPSLLPPPTVAREQISRSEVAVLLATVCWARSTYSTREQGMARAVWTNSQEGTTLPVAPYLCPFRDKYHGNHWHIGQVFTEHELELIAAAIRWCAAHPDERPTPPRRR